MTPHNPTSQNQTNPHDTSEPTQSTQPIQVDIWTDILCPWCYIGKRRFESAVAALPEGTKVDVTWRSFQLDPTTPRRSEDPNPQSVLGYLGDKYGHGTAQERLEQARMMSAQVAEVAADEGLHYDQSASVLANSADAHRLVHAAREVGGAELQDQLEERFFAGFFTQRQDIGDPETLTRLAVEAGLPQDVVRRVLDSDEYAAQVRQDQQIAQEIGVSGVPFFVIDRKFGISGAQPVEVFTQALQRALADA